MNTKELFENEYTSQENPLYIWEIRYKAELIKSLKLNTNNILDIGGGHNVLKQVLTDKTIKTLDFAGNPDIHQDLNNNESIPQSESTICTQVLQYVNNPIQVFKKILNATQKQAVFIIPIHNTSPETGMLHKFNTTDLINTAKEEDFKVKKITYVSGPFNWSWKRIICLHSHLNGRKYRRKEYCDTPFRKLLLHTGINLKIIDFTTSYIIRRNAMITFERTQ